MTTGLQASLAPHVPYLLYQDDIHSDMTLEI